MLTSDGQVPSKLVIEKIDYHIAGMTVTVSYNNENDEVAAVLYAGDGTIDFRPQGGFVPEDELENLESDGSQTIPNGSEGSSKKESLIEALKKGFSVEVTM